MYRCEVRVPRDTLVLAKPLIGILHWYTKRAPVGGTEHGQTVDGTVLKMVGFMLVPTRGASRLVVE